jgi:hypothetical protein
VATIESCANTPPFRTCTPILNLFGILPAPAAYMEER